jgi:hypothetical protein
MLAATARELPIGDSWVLQPKYDGWRLLIEVLHGGRARAWSRHGAALAGRLGGLEDLAAAAIPAGTLLDGELVALVAGPDQRPVQDFAAIGRAVTGSDVTAQRRLRFVAFDAPRAGERTSPGARGTNATNAYAICSPTPTHGCARSTRSPPSPTGTIRSSPSASRARCSSSGAPPTATVATPPGASTRRATTSTSRSSPSTPTATANYAPSAPRGCTTA